MNVWYGFIIFMIFLAGCHKKELKIETKSLKEKKTEYEQLLAQHSEIPDSQLGFEVDSIVQNSIDSQSVEIIYKPRKKNTITIQQLKESYVADMEILGWKMIAEFDGPTMQLIFQKAGRKLLSTIEIQSNLQVKIIVYTKK